MDYQTLINKIINLLSKTEYAILATSSKEGIVTASKMCMISKGTTLYFQTNIDFEKARNIMENPNVAVTIENIYFKGQAHIIGKAKDNEYFVNKMKEKHYKTYLNYTNLESQILIEVNLTECKIWGFWPNQDNEKEEAINVINIKEKNIQKIKCKNIYGGY